MYSFRHKVADAKWLANKEWRNVICAVLNALLHHNLFWCLFDMEHQVYNVDVGVQMLLVEYREKSVRVIGEVQENR